MFVLGHSGGGMAAPRVAAAEPPVADIAAWLRLGGGRKPITSFISRLRR